MSVLLFQCIGVPTVTLIFAWLCMYFGLSDTYSYFPEVATKKLYDIDSNIGIQSQFWSIANVSRFSAVSYCKPTYFHVYFLRPIYGHYVFWSVCLSIHLSHFRLKFLVKVVFDEVEVQST